MVALVGALATHPSRAQSVPASVEEVAVESDLIVLGKVVSSEPQGIEVGPMKTLVTRHSFRVETYFKGSGPEEIPLLTLGGIAMTKIGDQMRKVWTQAVGAEGVRVGEETLAFLRKGPEGFYFVEDDGAKYLIQGDVKVGNRSVELRLRKKKYMHGAALEGFKKLEAMEGEQGATERVEAKLTGAKFLTETVSLKEVRGRIDEIIRGEVNSSK